MPHTLLHLHNTTIKNNGNTVFNNLNFTIHSGEQWALVGKSGSGKTLLLEAIAGKKMMVGGAINLPQNIVLVSPKHRFKNLSNTTTLYYQQRFNSSDSQDAQTVSEYLASANATTTAPFWTIDTITARLNLKHLADKEVIKLSNGEMRRLLLAEALLKNPKLLLLDSPLTGLDVNSRVDFSLLLSEITALGIHVIITANAEDLPDCITHVATLQDCGITNQQLITDFKQQALVSETKSIDVVLLNKLLSQQPAMHYENIIRMKNVMIQYGEKTILNDVNWTVLQGERWVLSGHNGAGKSTLLSLVNGDNPQAYANDIVLFDRQRGSGESIWEIKKKIGFVSPELFQYFPADASCSDVIESGLYDTMGLFRKPLPANAALMSGWAQLLGIETDIKKLFRNVPDSIQRLCLLARALIKNPPLLLFDEPTQGMDTAQRDHFKFLVNSICYNSNATLIYVSHYTEDIPECVTKKLMLKDGKIIDNE